MKLAIAALPALILLAWGSLYIPFLPKLELYCIQDITLPNTPVSGGNFPRGCVNLGAEPDEFVQIVGECLMRRLQRSVPGLSDKTTPRSISIQDGLLIVRATRPQQVAVNMAIAFTRGFAR